MYKLSTLAADDFAAIYEYTLLNFGVRQADAYTDDLETVMQLLAGSPLMGHECPEIAHELRRHDHQRHAIFYRRRARDIYVIRILHQQWSRCGTSAIFKKMTGCFSLTADHLITQGPEAAPMLYVFADPNCVFCHRIYRRVQPLVRAEQIQQLQKPGTKTPAARDSKWRR